MANLCPKGPDVALVGYGGWGKNIARTLHRLGALKAVVDVDKVAGTSVPDTTVVFRTYADVLRDASVKAVAIATPTPTHFSLAKAALEAGKDVFLEKPFVQTLAELSILKEKAQGHILMVGHLMRYHNAFIKMKNLCDQGVIGTIVKIETFRKNFGKFHAHEGTLWDIGPHDFSMIYHLLGRCPDWVRCVSTTTVFPGHSDTDHISMGFGPVVTETQLSRIHPQKQQKVVVVGTKGSLVLDDTQPWSQKLTHYKHRLAPGVAHGGEGVSVEVLEESPLVNQMRHFLQAVQERGAVETPLAEAEAVLQMIHAAEASRGEHDSA